MTWRREDWGYAGAAVAAAILVIYLVAGNFGLVPSPLSPNDLASEPPTITAIQVTSALGEGPLPVLPVAVPPVLRPAAPVPFGDAGAPSVAFSTPDGATFGVAEPAVVEGRATDAASGIERLLVVFVDDSGSRRTSPAELTCSDATRRRCSWSADVPAILANYTVRAEAIDAAGNSAKAEPIAVTVVNTGGAVKGLTDTVQRVPSALTHAVEVLLGFLGG